MKNNGSSAMLKSLPMNGGDDKYSYSKNSVLQKEMMSSAKSMIDEEIANKFDVKDVLGDSSSINIADLGCSIGPNTFICMENIIEAVKNKYQSQCPASQMPEFQVFFNDQVMNDFNTLFRNLPTERPYFGAGVPGSFHAQLFPKSSLHLVHTSLALQWLSHLPQEVLDENSPTWNKGKILYSNVLEPVGRAYAAQFAKDLEIFFDARAKELVSGGTLVLLIPSTRYSSTSPWICHVLDLLGSAMMDMAKEGLINEAQVDSFNLPVYYASPEEIIQPIERNGCFKIERVEFFCSNSAMTILSDARQCAMHYRATTEALLTNHFGSEIIDELFDRFSKKIEEFSSQLQLRANESNLLFLALKRK